MQAFKPLFIIMMLFIVHALSAQTHNVRRGSSTSKPSTSTQTRNRAKKANTAVQKRKSTNRNLQSPRIAEETRLEEARLAEEARREEKARREEAIRKNGGKQIVDVDIPSPLKNVPEQILVRKGYVVSYNEETRLPNWVAWRIIENHVDGIVKLPNNAWNEDTDVPLQRATSNDYNGSNWTRGLMCPADDNKWDSAAMFESFLYTNCCPMNSNLNNGTWNQIEIACRQWAKRYGSVQIVSGPIFYNMEHTTIGENKVVVPEAFFKVILCLDENHPKGLAFICKNTDGNGIMDLYVNSIRQVERITGMTFFPHLPKNIVEMVKNQANITEW